MARVAEPRHDVSRLIAAACHAGVQSAPFTTPVDPTDEHRALMKIEGSSKLLTEAEDAIRHKDQDRVPAAIQIY